KIVVAFGRDVPVLAVEAAARVAQKARPLVGGERDVEKARDLRTRRVDGALHLEDERLFDLDVEGAAGGFVDVKSVRVDFSRRRGSTVHGGSQPPALLQSPEFRTHED